MRESRTHIKTLAQRQDARRPGMSAAHPGVEPDVSRARPVRITGTGGCEAIRDPYRLVGRNVGPYAVEEHLGGGGMGVVYKAEDTRLKRPVVLKLMPPHLLADADAVRRFRHEARIASSLDHPFIATIYEVGETEEGCLFMVMAFYAGETMEARIARGPMDLDEAVRLGAQVARALGEAHACGIVHRDVKPANVMVVPGRIRRNGRQARAKDTAKLLDFGIAKMTGLGTAGEDERAGTAPYMAPEQVRGEEADERTDVWGLGSMLYEMVTGERPFCGDYREVVNYMILNQDPVPMRVVRENAPPDLEALVLQCLAKQPKDRPASADEVADRLESIRRSVRDGSRREVATGRDGSVRSAWMRVAGLLMLALLLLAG